MNLLQIGKRIKQCRIRQNLTQEDLAEKIDLAPHYIYEIERGSKTMSMFTLYKISNALNISADYILTGNTKEPPNEPNDQLALILENLPDTQRNDIANIISAILPYIK